MVVEAILNGKYLAHLTMKDLMEPFPLEWDRQREHFFSECVSTKEMGVGVKVLDG